MKKIIKITQNLPWNIDSHETGFDDDFEFFIDTLDRCLLIIRDHFWPDLFFGTCVSVLFH